MPTKAKNTPAPEEHPLGAEGAAADVTITPPDLDAPTSSDPPASLDPAAVQSAPSPLDESTFAVDDSTPVTMADVAALNGIGLAPDASRVRVVHAGDEDAPFISAGMASDLEQQGWALDPATGRAVYPAENQE